MKGFAKIFVPAALFAAVNLSSGAKACPPDESKSLSAPQGPVAVLSSHDGVVLVASEKVDGADKDKSDNRKMRAPRARALAVPGDTNVNIATNRSDAPWIGVRLTAVPDPLAAHIGNNGLMIANVAKGSPAEAIGLKQYDVIVSFDGQQVSDLDDLVQAVAAVGTTRAAPIDLIRSAQRTTVQITPAKRPDDELAWVFPEPKDPMVENMSGHGFWMKPGPNGNWVFQDIDNLPDVHDILKNLDLKQWSQFMPAPGKIDINTMNDQQMWRLWQSNDDDDDANAKMAFKINVVQDGKGTSIEHDADGKITVTHTDADGKESTATYDSIDELQKADPEAYELIQNMHGGRGFSFKLGPGAMQLHNGNFRMEIAKRLQDARDQQDRSRLQADQLHNQMHQHMMNRHGAAADNSNISVNIGDGGAITVRVTENNDVQAYRFDSKEDFKQQKPELYERVRSLFED